MRLISKRLNKSSFVVSVHKSYHIFSHVRVRIKHFIETNETEIEAETQSRRR
jgi:hypothetical protein